MTIYGFFGPQHPDAARKYNGAGEYKLLQLDKAHPSNVEVLCHEDGYELLYTLDHARCTNEHPHKIGVRCCRVYHTDLVHVAVVDTGLHTTTVWMATPNT